MRSHLWECLEIEGLSRGNLDVLLAHSGQLENYSDDLIWRLDRVGSYTDDILKLVDDYGEVFTRELNADDLRRLGRLVNEGLSDDVVDAVIKHVDYFAGYSDDAIKKIAESGCNAERILTQMDNYAKDFTEDLTAGQLKRLDDILEQGITQEQFEVLIKHGKQLDDYTDEIVTLWRSYEGNSDDFLNLVDEFGDEFVEAFQENGDEAVEGFRELLGAGLETGGLIKEGLGKISGNKYTVTQRGVDNIKSYLAEQGFINDYENRAMLERLENALENGEKITGADAVFYTHELKEAQLVASGVEQSVAHKMALEYYEVSPYSVYHPDVIKMEPEWWNNAWFEFWEIER